MTRHHYRNTGKTHLLLGRNLSCNAAGAVAGGVAADVVELSEEHLKIPGIKALIDEKVLVPTSAPVPAEVKTDAKADAKIDADAKAKAEADLKAKAEAEAKARADADASKTKGK